MLRVPKIPITNVILNPVTWIDHWSKYHKQLLSVNKEILELVDLVIEKDRILWVIGY